MKLPLDEAKNISQQIIIKLGFNTTDADLITKNLIDGELANRKSHGLVRLPVIKQKLEQGQVSNTQEEVEFIKETPNSLLVNAKHKPAFISIYKSLEKAIPMAKQSGMAVVGIQEAEYCSGYIGSYARQATAQDLIYLGFNNSPPGLVPHGATKDSGEQILSLWEYLLIAFLWF